MRNLTSIGILISILLAIDIYAFQGVKFLVAGYAPNTKKIIYIIYWSFTVIMATSFFLGFMVDMEKWNRVIRFIMMSTVSISVFTKLFFVVFLLIDDITRVFKWVGNLLGITSNVTSEIVGNENVMSSGNGISRSEFLVKAGVAFAAIPAIGMTWGIISGAHDYRVRKRRIVIPHLPKQFDGIRLAQISDVHTGSFYNKTAVKGGIELLLKEKPDFITFTGDLVNNISSELRSYIDVFDKLKAPLGVYSILGNHDYGDYYRFNSLAAKKQNLQDLITAEKQMGWDLLINEHRNITVDGASISLMGIENWSAKGRFPKYGKLAEAYKGSIQEEKTAKILLSHDPSHWDAEVLTQYKDIDLTLSGHTHGMQFGVDSEVFKWSPVKYMYPRWADLYREGNQHLYVNRGYGYIGFQGRIGILPEITIIELVRA